MFACLTYGTLQHLCVCGCRFSGYMPVSKGVSHPSPSPFSLSLFFCTFLSNSQCTYQLFCSEFLCAHNVYYMHKLFIYMNVLWSSSYESIAKYPTNRHILLSRYILRSKHSRWCRLLVDAKRLLQQTLGSLHAALLTLIAAISVARLLVR